MVKRVAGARRPAREPAPPPGEPAPAVRAGADRAHETGETDETIVVGRIGRPQGIKGEVTVEVRTDDPDDRFAAGAVLLTEGDPLTVASSRMQGKYLVVAFEGVLDRNGAELLRDTMLSVRVADLPPLADEDEYYDSQLVGLPVETADGTGLGTVVDVLHLPGGDVLAVQRTSRLAEPPGPELLIPFVRAFVPEVDLEGGRVVVEPPPGLLELSDGPPPGDTAAPDEP